MSASVQQYLFTLCMPPSCDWWIRCIAALPNGSSEACLSGDIPACNIHVLQSACFSQKHNSSLSSLLGTGSTQLHQPRGMLKEGRLRTFPHSRLETAYNKVSFSVGSNTRIEMHILQLAAGVHHFFAPLPPRPPRLPAEPPLLPPRPPPLPDPPFLPCKVAPTCQPNNTSRVPLY